MGDRHPGLAGRVAVITGATGAVGRLIAQRLAERGTRLALLGTHAGRLTELAQSLSLAADNVLTHVVDLRDRAATQAAAQVVLSRFGRLDIVLHLVGGYVGGQPALAVPVDDVNRMLEQHLWSTLNVTQAFAPLLVSNGWGRLIAISSPHATTTPPRRAAFAIGKAAQEALLMTLAQELRGTGVTANVLVVRELSAPGDQPDPAAPPASDSTSPKEVAAAILYLCSDEARAVNGARLPLDGR